MAGRTVDHLMQDVAFALEQGLGSSDLVPMLKQLVKLAEVGSEAHRYGRLCLARQLLADEPFRAASICRLLTLEDESCDESWGLYGLSLTVLGHYRAARQALERACRLAPEHPGHAHNLGHLLDAAFRRPLSALPWLRRAFEGARDEPSIATSFAHALCASGQVTQALDVLRLHARMDEETARSTLEQWRQLPPK